MTHPSSILWHPSTQHGLRKPEIEIERAQGASLYTPGGTRIIDAIASWWVITHGHCHPAITQAVQKQAAELDQVIFAGFTHKPAQRTAELLLKRSPHHAHVFLSDSGSTAVEVALKMATGYWYHKGEKRHKIIALEKGYHGDTFGAMAAGARSFFNKVYEPFLFDVMHTPVPSPGHEDAALSALETMLKQHGNETAAFIFEPLVQGAGGMRMYAPEMLKAMCELCQSYGILLIADEVMTGFGRTGSFFACDQAGVHPDLRALSKGLTAGFLPMGATLATHEIYKAFYHDDRGKMFFHSTSFSGNPQACAAAAASLELWDNENVTGKIQEIEAAHKAQTDRLKDAPRVKDIRQQGTILALELDDPTAGGYLADSGQHFYDFALERGILMRPLGAVLYVLPPYCIEQQDLDHIYLCLEDFLLKELK